MIVITGAQRSGTSFTTNFFKQCGFNVGSNFWHSDINGGLENLQVCHFFRSYIGDKTFPFSDIPLGDIKEKQRSLDLSQHEVIKFSYMLMLPAIPYIWNKHRGNSDRLLILTRSFESICESKKRVSRFGTDSILLDQNSSHLEYNFNLSLRIIKILGFRYEILKFPELLQDFKSFSNTILKLGIDIREREDVWDSLVDFKKVHFK